MCFSPPHSIVNCDPFGKPSSLRSLRVSQRFQYLQGSNKLVPLICSKRRCGSARREFIHLVQQTPLLHVQVIQRCVLLLWNQGAAADLMRLVFQRPLKENGISQELPEFGRQDVRIVPPACERSRSLRTRPDTSGDACIFGGFSVRSDRCPSSVSRELAKRSCARLPHLRAKSLHAYFHFARFFIPFQRSPPV